MSGQLCRVPAESIEAAKDLAFTLAVRPETEVETGVISHAAAYAVREGQVAIHFFDTEPIIDAFLVVKHELPIPHLGSEFARVREFTFDSLPRLLRPSIQRVSLEETIEGKTMEARELIRPSAPPSYYARRKAYKERRRQQKESARLSRIGTAEELPEDKFAYLLQALRNCSYDNRIAVGREVEY